MRTIHPFPARMAPNVVSKLLDSLPGHARVLDPMCGSGVVLRQSVQAGHIAVGFDIDPLAVLMSRVWTRKVNHARLVDIASQIVRGASKRRAGCAALPWVRACGETKAFIEYWFAEPQRSHLARLSIEIKSRSSDLPIWAVEALLVAMSRTIVTKQAGASLAWDVSHSRPHRVRDTNEYDVMSGFLRSAERLAFLLEETKIERSAKVSYGDCRDLKAVGSDSFDVVVTSPPYLNAIDYLRGHKLSLVWMGYPIPTLRKIRAEAVGTERTNSSFYASEDLIRDIQKSVPRFTDLPLRQRGIVRKYSEDAIRMIGEMRRVLKRRGRMVLVLADSVVRGVDVESSKIFERVALSNGFKLIDREVREIPQDRRYLPIKTSSHLLQKRMRNEIIQEFRLVR